MKAWHGLKVQPQSSAITMSFNFRLLGFMNNGLLLSPLKGTGQSRLRLIGSLYLIWVTQSMWSNFCETAWCPDPCCISLLYPVRSMPLLQQATSSPPLQTTSSSLLCKVKWDTGSLVGTARTRAGVTAQTFSLKFAFRDPVVWAVRGPAAWWGVFPSMPGPASLLSCHGQKMPSWLPLFLKLPFQEELELLTSLFPMTGQSCCSAYTLRRQSPARACMSTDICWCWALVLPVPVLLL